MDASIASETELRKWIEQTIQLQGPVYVHCAEGRGRTGLFAAALLLQLGQANTAEQALSRVKEKRPQIKLNVRQFECLSEFVEP